jgi:hypothetical protein
MASRRPPRERGAHQVAFTVRAPVQRRRTEQLRRVLEGMGAPGIPGDGTPAVPFAQLHGVHLARFVLLEDAVDPVVGLVPASLVYMSDVDAPLERHLDELADLGGAALDAAFGLCEGWPAAPTPATRRAYLQAHALRSGATYVNAVGRTVEQVLREEELRRAIAGFLDARDGACGEDPQAVRRAVQDFVRGREDLAWARRRAPSPPLRRRASDLAHLLGVSAGLLAATPLLVVVVPLWAIALRLRERADPDAHERPSLEHVRALAAVEDHVAHNQFSVVGSVKPGLLRRATLAVVLWLIDVAARHVFRRADLAGVKTIHFARWIVIDGGRRAIFASTYDGALESYMDDFIDKVAFGLNASFSNAVGYPRTRLLLFEGAKREEEFKALLRTRQVPAQSWWSAYEGLSAGNIENNALVRSGLFGTLADAEARAWLRRL